MTPSGERRWDRLAIVHGLLFAAGVATAVIDLVSSRGFDESTLVSSVSLPLAGLALGVAHVGTGRPGGRPILIVADLGLLVGAAASALSTIRGPFASPGEAIPAVIVGGLAGLAALVAMAARVPTPPSPPRIIAHRLAAVALFGFTVITLIAPFFAIDDVSMMSIFLIAVPSLVGVTVALTAWWYGSGWLLALFGIGSLAASLDVVLALSSSPSWNHLIVGIAAVAMGLLAPRSVPRRSASQTAAGAQAGSPPSRRRRPVAAAVWAGIGAVLFVPTVLLGRWVPGFVDCFDQCPPLSPLADATVPLTWLAVVFVPLAALAVALEPRSRPGASAWTALVGLVGVAVVLGQVALGIEGIEPFTFVTIGAPATVLCATGFVAALAAPRWLAGTGQLAAVGSGVAGLLWMAEGLGAGGGIFDLPLVETASLVSGAVVTVALGRAFGEGTVDLPEPTGADPDLTSAPAVAAGP